MLLQNFNGPLHEAELDATMFASGNASECITQGSCLPLGGHSVWAALPPLPVTGSDNKPVVLVAAGMDSTAFFHARAKVRSSQSPCAKLQYKSTDDLHAIMNAGMHSLVCCNSV